MTFLNTPGQNLRQAFFTIRATEVRILQKDLKPEFVKPGFIIKAATNTILNTGAIMT